MNYLTRYKDMHWCYAASVKAQWFKVTMSVLAIYFYITYTVIRVQVTKSGAYVRFFNYTKQLLLKTFPELTIFIYVPPKAVL